MKKTTKSIGSIYGSKYSILKKTPLRVETLIENSFVGNLKKSVIVCQTYILNIEMCKQIEALLFEQQGGRAAIFVSADI